MLAASPKTPSRRSRRRDAHNRRVRKVVAYGGVENSGDVRNGTTDYAYQGWRVLWEHHSGDPQTFVYGNYLDEVWNVMTSHEWDYFENYYFLSGVNYSVMGVIDALGGNALAEAYEYDPYGRHRVIDPGTDTTYFTSDDTYAELAPGAIGNSIRYTGQRFDAESGLMYYKNRYYDPSAGRFIGRDPLGWDEGPNRYGYVGGRPTMAVDPVGLWFFFAKSKEDELYGPRTRELIKAGIVEDMTGNILPDESIARQQAIYRKFMPQGSIRCKLQSVENCVETTQVITIEVIVIAATYPLPPVFSGARLVRLLDKLGDALRFSKAARRYSDDLIREAQKKYPRLAGKEQDHHIVPLYLGGDPKGKTVKLDAAYHQEITNAFNAEFRRGTGMFPSEDELIEIMRKVYEKYPLPPGCGIP